MGFAQIPLKYMNTLKFPSNDRFFFGVSNAAAQVEDQLSDTWQKMAEDGKIPCYNNVPTPKDKLKFWSEPEVELDIAKDLGVDVFRLSFDWHRLCPREGVWDEKAADRYLEILKMIKKRGMKVMATLFHHGVPVWFADKGGWPKRFSKKAFQFYSEKAFCKFNDQVDYWITLNEPVPWSYLSYVEGIFPPGKKGTFVSHQLAQWNMQKAHSKFYKFAKEIDPDAKIGVANHMGLHIGKGNLNKALSKLSDYLGNWAFMYGIKKDMDFFGINYYGAEWMTLKGPAQYTDLEYSDAGRAVCPKGLLRLLRKISKEFKGMPIIISENGIGDGTDWIRPAYLAEHLAAIHKAMEEEVPIEGYIHWTLCDNFEWSDGYGPKFGLVEVDRINNCKRIKRKSFYLYKKIIESRELSFEQREEAWKKYSSKMGLGRPYWRSSNNKNGLNNPTSRMTPYFDWRLK